MATTSNTYTANGTNKLFSITFPYLDTSDINVYLNGVLQTITTQYSFANATTVEFVTAPANGAVVLLDRSTDDTALQATFFPGSSIKADDLNFNFDQVLYLAQETANSAANQSTAGLQAQITAANNTSNTALTTANAADATANGIAGTANTALTNANAAVVTANAANATAIAADATANGIAATANSALVAANAALPLAGGTMTGVITYATAQPRLVSGTSVSATSGTAIDFTSIPSWAKRVTAVLDQVSCNNAGSNLLIQLGTSSGVETTGYLSYGSAQYYDTSVPGEQQVSFASTIGFLAQFGLAESFRSGQIVFTNITGNRWIGAFNIAAATNIPSPPRQLYGSITGGGTKQLSGVLDRVRITWDVTATFDLGNINIIYEG
jgi:hypothetical protein